MNNYTDKIDELLTKFSFEELSAEEQTLVLTEMSAADYTMHREIVLSTQKLKNSGQPTLPSNLHASLKKKIKAIPSNKVAYHRNAWLYTLLGVIVGGLGMTAWFTMFFEKSKSLPQQIQNTITIDTVYVQKHDTLFLPAKPEIKIITKEVIKYIEKEVPVIIAASQNDESNKSTDSPTENSGTAISQEIELMDLLQEIPSDSFIEKD